MKEPAPSGGQQQAVWLWWVPRTSPAGRWSPFPKMSGRGVVGVQGFSSLGRPRGALHLVLKIGSGTSLTDSLTHRSCLTTGDRWHGRADATKNDPNPRRDWDRDFRYRSRAHARAGGQGGGTLLEHCELELFQVKRVPEAVARHGMGGFICRSATSRFRTRDSRQPKPLLTPDCLISSGGGGPILVRCCGLRRTGMIAALLLSNQGWTHRVSSRDTL